MATLLPPMFQPGQWVHCVALNHKVTIKSVRWDSALRTYVYTGWVTVAETKEYVEKELKPTGPSPFSLGMRERTSRWGR
jgi:hypothetical protein